MTSDWHQAIDHVALAQGLKAFDPKIRQPLSLMVQAPFEGWFRDDQVRDLCKKGGLTRRDLLLQLLPLAQVFARAPLSQFRVGAVVEGATGRVYLGANLEFGQSPLQQTLHAEQAAMIMAVQDEPFIKQIATSAAPCGHCRQFLYEWDLKQQPMKLIIPTGECFDMNQLLPQAFGPADLGHHQSPLQASVKELVLCDQESQYDRIAQAAMREAVKSHVPYSQCPGGAAIVSRDGRVFAGRAIDNAAFNPSVHPLQAALIRLNMAGLVPASAERIVLALAEVATVDYLQAAMPLVANLGLPNPEVWAFRSRLPR